MARRSAINPVAKAVVAVIDVLSFRALCPGGVYRALRPLQSPPYTVVGPCAERPGDTFGADNLGSTVTVPVSVAWATGDDHGEDRAAAIIEHALALLEVSPPALTVPGWAVLYIRWVATTEGKLEYPDGSWADATVATLDVTVRAS